MFRRPGLSVTVVMASQVNEDTSWLQRLFPFWKHEIYITDPPGTNSSLISVKGLESMVYLTYIIDNYEVLPDVVIFTHGGRYRWHHDDPLYDNARVLSRLQIPYVQKQGYVNLRCVWTVGCPAEIHINRKGGDKDLANGGPLPGAIYAAAFHDLFPGRDLPSRVGTSCCANFAAAKSAIVARPRQDYERYRRWLVDTDLDSSAGAKVLEYSWHIIFGKEAAFCPLARQCYCKVFGMCNIPLEGPGTSKAMYSLPKFATLPDGWPWVGWDNQWQNATSVGYIPGEELIDSLPTTLW
ncbi:hypothetical protein E4T43_09059 [Aureobasidium subglaciale]|nr:hypothetical protein E4T43_09059 [Aureobasidium subglaciale]